MSEVRIQFSRFSAFYTPLLVTISSRFLKEEGLSPNWSVANSPIDATQALENGSAHVIQSAVSQAFETLNHGKKLKVTHFAQINEMDGFFLTSRNKDTNFSWKSLEGSSMILQPGGQPLSMFKYACKKANIDFDTIKVLSLNDNETMDQAFRSGKGDYIHQQGPAPQQLEADGCGYIVAKVGELVGPCAFSSLAARQDWLESNMAFSFMRAYEKARIYICESSAMEIATMQKQYFQNVDHTVLAACLQDYKELGCWSKRSNISYSSYEAILDIFQYNNIITKRYSYDEICALPPGNK